MMDLYQNPDEIEITIPLIIQQLSMMDDILVHFTMGSEGKEDRLVHFINAVRKQSAQPLITNVELKNPFTIRHYLTDKESILDIRARDEQNNTYNVEFQTISRKYFVNRIVYYNSKTHSAQLKEGTDYKDIYPTISIVLVQDWLFPTLNGAFQSFYLTSQTDPNVILTKDIQFHFLQLTKNLKQRLNNVNEDLSDWMQFFNLPITSETEMKSIIKRNPSISEAWRDVRQFVENDKNLIILEARQKARLDRATDLHCAFDDGKAEGMLEGRLKGMEEGMLEGRLKGKEEGILEGRLKGKEEGILEGRLKGKEEGMLEGRLKGEAEGMTKMLLSFLNFQIAGGVPQTIQERVRKICEESTISELAQKTRQVQTLSELESILKDYD